MSRLRSAAFLPAALVLAAQAPEALADRVARVDADLAFLDRFYTVPGGAVRAERLRTYLRQELQAVASLPMDGLGLEERLDATLLRQSLTFRQRQLDEALARRKTLAPLLPFAEDLNALAEDRRLMKVQEPKACATLLARLAKGVRDAGAQAEAVHPAPLQAQRAAREVKTLRQVLEEWQRFYLGYDPLMTWWCERPVKSLDGALEAYGKTLEKLGGVEGKDQILGDPIGREALKSALEAACIAYSPEELVELGRQEMAWCQKELKKAAREMGFGDDWRAALEKVKNCYVAPGEQPALIKKLADEAIAYVESKDLVTVPPLAKEAWRMEMLSAEAQKVSPFFLGGEMIQVSFPTQEMEHAQKLMSLRGNNPAFARATVFHELIPGHHLQGFMAERVQRHRQFFQTPFLVEGWALYWEMLLWDLRFPRTPEEKIGMLVWRQHRCARIFFSLGFHLGRMSPQQCVDLLVSEVGFERANAEAEVRRSLQGGYGPLYQAAYMVGGQQLRALSKELVGTGKMGLKAFHDAVLQSGPIPIELIRARLKGEAPGPDWRPSWRFYDGLH